MSAVAEAPGAVRVDAVLEAGDPLVEFVDLLLDFLDLLPPGAVFGVHLVGDRFQLVDLVLAQPQFFLNLLVQEQAAVQRVLVVARPGLRGVNGPPLYGLSSEEVRARSQPGRPSPRLIIERLEDRLLGGPAAGKVLSRPLVRVAGANLALGVDAA